ncbi:hypothetical protein [Actinospica robiniae]|uniref:hypothetical protein n=1 Tax=Actinospica robiniae TaxID=304901 RepID=UPI00042232B4|nr:hypothetical protein [Actinospica robiniae]
MDLVTGTTFILPAVLFAVWLVSWRWERWTRWVLVCLGISASVLLAVIPTVIIGRQPAAPFVPPMCDSPMCWESGRSDPLAWWVAGFVGVAFCVALALLTGLIEIALDVRRRASA